MSVEQSNTVSLPLTGLPLTGLPLSGLPLTGLPLSGLPLSDLPLSGSPSFTSVWIPGNFPYLAAFLHGRPRHDRDEFSFTHPQMDQGKRAKIFAPFDALDGYSDAVKSKDVEYVQQIDLTEDTLAEEDRDELARRLEILHRLTYNGPLARKNHVRVNVTYFVPCADENSLAYGVRGLYKTITGICWKVDPVGRTMTVDQAIISLKDIIGIDDIDSVFDDKGIIEAP